MTGAGINETAMLLSGQLVRNERGTFYFDKPGNWVDKDGWPVTERLHCEAGVAAIYTSGDIEWWVNGRLHCDNGPAIIYADGTKEWYVNGEFVK